jgi:starch phosphorylase
MWRPLFRNAVEPPITHVTNGAHLPTWVNEPMRRLLDEHIGDTWIHGPGPAAWERVREIPNAALWAARCESRLRLFEYLRTKSAQDGLLRGEQLEYVNLIESSLDPHSLTIGFARRLATYKRFHLLSQDPDRTRRIFGGIQPAQLVIAGKAHPNDEPGKDALQRFYNFEHNDPQILGRVVIVEDYDIGIAQQLVSGCDLWLNLPRKPMEASGTSGMKATFNGALQLSVLDGWWAEGYNGTNGWAIPGSLDADAATADAGDAALFYDLLEHEVIPLFYERDADGIPQGWCNRVKEALVTLAPQFSATRMVNDYVERIYRT